MIRVSEGSLCLEGASRTACRRAMVSRTEKDALRLGTFDGLGAQEQSQKDAARSSGPLAGHSPYLSATCRT